MAARGYDPDPDRLVQSSRELEFPKYCLPAKRACAKSDFILARVNSRLSASNNSELVVAAQYFDAGKSTGQGLRITAFIHLDHQAHLVVGISVP